MMSLPLADAGDNIVALVAVVLIFGGGSLVRYVVESINRTRLEMAQLRAQQGSSAAAAGELQALRTEVAELRREVTALRDTSTQYDLSFDTALERTDQRIARLEQLSRNAVVEAAGQINRSGA